jgi:hypothetical protein
MGFASLQHMRNRRSLVRTACQPIAGTSAGFGYPLDALLPSTPCRFCFAPAALMGFTLRSFLLAKGIWRFPAGSTHVPFRSPPKSARKHSIRAGDSRFLGFAPFESPWRSNPCLAGQSLDAPLGFALPGPAGKRLVRDFARTPLTCLARVNGAYAACTTESRSTLAWSGRAATANRSEQPDNPRRVPAPAIS